MEYGRRAAFVVAWALSTAPPAALAYQHQHGSAPQATPPGPRPETALHLKDVLKAADRSLGALEKAARGATGSAGGGAQAVRDYLSLVGWVERHFLAAGPGAGIDARDVERTRQALVRQHRHLASIDGGALDQETARLVGQARDAAAAALTAVDSTLAGRERGGGCGHC